MSIIQLHSKNIYDKYNQKCYENNINAVLLNIKTPQIEQKDENVYNEKIFGDFYGGSTQTDLQTNSSLNMLLKKVDVISAYIKLTPTYLTKTITVPKQGHNLNVLKLLTGYNSYGSSNVKYTIYGTTIRGTATAVADLANKDNKYVKDLQIQETSTDSGMYFIRDNDINVSLYYSQATSSLGRHDVTANVNLDNKENILTATATEYKDHFTINLTILSGIEKITVAGFALWANDEPKASQVVNMSGDYIKYIPRQVDLSLAGSVIKLNLIDGKVEIGNANYGDKRLYDWQGGSELDQTTNSPTPQETYQKVIDEWKWGKETAEIKCSIDDYYDENNNLVISPNQPNLPMRFHCGDLVCPYVYTAKGVDKPMAFYVDNTPKVFEVVGEGISYRGRVMQKITLLEISQNRLKELNKHN